MSTDWLDEMPYDPPQPRPGHKAPNPLDTLVGLACWLSEPKRLEFLRHHDLALSFHDEVKVAVERCRLAVDTPAGREADVEIGPHPGCGGTVMGHVPDDYTGGMATSTCTGCDGVWTADEQRELYERIKPTVDREALWIGTWQAATMLGVSDRTVRGMVADGRLQGDVRANGKRRLTLVLKSEVIMRRDERLAG